jgi:hypothetical protein
MAPQIQLVYSPKKVRLRSGDRAQNEAYRYGKDIENDSMLQAE